MNRIRHLKAAVVLVLIVLFASSPTADAQLLDMMRKHVREPKSHSVKTESPPVESRPTWSNPFDDDSTVRDFFAITGLVVVASPFWIPRYLTGDDNFGMPRFSGVPGVSDPALSWLTQSEEPFQLSAWSTQFSIDYLSDFNGLSAPGNRLLVETNSRFGIDTTFRFYSEEPPSSTNDQLSFGDINLVYRFAQNERLRMRSGFGVNWMRDDTETDFGFNFTYGGDWFLTAPWSVSTDLDIGRLGNANLYHSRVTLGRQFQQAEIFVGYDWLRIDDTDADGMLVGLRWWF